MRRQDYSDITLVLDKSGSMHRLQGDTIGGVNRFVQDQKVEPGYATFTLVQFDTTYAFTHKAVPIGAVPDLTTLDYKPSGDTALRDAMGRAILETGQRLAAMAEDERPARVLFVVVTDGEENSSREITQEALQAMVREQTEVYQWEFLFLGANVDAFQQAGSVGIGVASAAAYGANSAGIQAAYDIASDKVRMSRRAGMRGMSVAAVNMSYTVDDRAKLDATVNDTN